MRQCACLFLCASALVVCTFGIYASLWNSWKFRLVHLYTPFESMELRCSRLSTKNKNKIQELVFGNYVCPCFLSRTDLSLSRLTSFYLELVMSALDLRYSFLTQVCCELRFAPRNYFAFLLNWVPSFAWRFQKTFVCATVANAKMRFCFQELRMWLSYI